MWPSESAESTSRDFAPSTWVAASISFATWSPAKRRVGNKAGLASGGRSADRGGSACYDAIFAGSAEESTSSTSEAEKLALHNFALSFARSFLHKLKKSKPRRALPSPKMSTSHGYSSETRGYARHPRMRGALTKRLRTCETS